MKTFSASGFGDPSGFAPQFADYVEGVVLAANTSARIPMPAGAAYVVFSFDGDFYAKVGISTVVAAVPSAITTDGSASELNPTQRRIASGGTHIALIAPAAQKGTLSFYG